MPPTLHPHLKRGLDFGPIHTQPDDAIEDASSGHYDAHAQEAKRRRIEAIASQYLLRGRAPVILSAGLRGPFDGGWKNPWRSTTTRPTRTASEKSSATVAGKSQVVAKNSSRNKGAVRVRVRARSSRVKNDERETQARIASPETSRATADALSFRNHDHDSSDEVEVEIPPATAPSPTQHDASGSTEFFSANTERLLHCRSPLSNPFWLRRPESERRGGVQFSQNGNTETSPTRTRSVRSQRAVTEKRRTLPVKTLIQATSVTAKTPLPATWRSSASTSMVISSPANNLGAANAIAPQRGSQLPATDQNNTEASISSIISEHSTQTVAAPSTEPGQLALSVSVAEKGPPAPSEAHVPLSAERHIPPVPAPAELAHQIIQQQVAKCAPRHDRVASPAPASSTGFKYRKLSDPKSKTNELSKPKVRTVDFDSSPASKKVAPVLSEEKKQVDDDVEEDAIPIQTVLEEHGPNLETVQNVQEQPDVPDDTITDLQRPHQDSAQSSHPSAMSTQAAMLLAQLEFQESTYRSLSPANTGRWSQISDNTPRPITHAPSPAITPLSVFGSRLDNGFSNDSVLRGPPISTQDLFGAASPFPFSTIKKQPSAPPQSGLRFGIAVPHDHDPKADNVSVKSPTPSAERIPLKVKGNTPSLWGIVNDKFSQASQDSLVDRSRKSVHDVELPQLDFHTSLDDFESNGGLHFTDRFLHNLDTA
ncbi:hypothetical protein NX059_006820 [Plenodomus lindquistii]|nr:hypothetical protein NX059_006820 [Plenodomus lindquistii]